MKYVYTGHDSSYPKIINQQVYNRLPYSVRRNYTANDIADEDDDIIDTALKVGTGILIGSMFDLGGSSTSDASDSSKDDGFLGFGGGMFGGGGAGGGW